MTHSERFAQACAHLARGVAMSRALLRDREARSFIATVLVEIEDALGRRGASPADVIDALVHVRWDGSLGPRLALLAARPLPDEKTPAERPSRK